jgi:hypothetical protein
VGPPQTDFSFMRRSELFNRALSLRRSVAVLVCAGAVLVVLAAPAAAQDKALADHFEFTLGTYLVDLGTTVQLNASTGASGTPIDLEKDLQLPGSETRFRVNALWRFAKHHSVQFGYYQVGRSAEATISRQITWGGSVYPINARVAAEMKTTVPEITYTYWPVVNDRVAVGASVGVTMLGLSAGLALSVNSVGVTPQIDTSTPVPLIGAQVRAKVVPRIYFVGSFGYINDFSTAVVTSGSIAGEVMVVPQLRVGVGYSGIKFDITNSTRFLNGSLGYTLSGIQLYGRVGF